MKLLAVVLLLLPLSGCLAEVVNDFTQNRCKDFFIMVNKKVTPPTVFRDNNNKDRYKQICQTLDNKAEFATLYDTKNKIPVYSAYRFKGLKKCTRLNKWYIEPQLDDPKKGGKNMERVSDEEYKNLHPKPNQALDGQYDESGFHRGHLAPVHHANSQSCADATFTLTNAAPQNPSFNTGRWRVTEGNMANKLDTDCKNMNMYVVTGVVPGNNEMKTTGVRVPSHYWTAYCCIDNTNKAKHSGAYIGENTDDKTKQVEDIPVKELEDKLKVLYKSQSKEFIVFGNKCYTNKKRKASPVTTNNQKRPKSK